MAANTSTDSDDAEACRFLCTPEAWPADSTEGSAAAAARMFELLTTDSGELAVDGLGLTSLPSNLFTPSVCEKLVVFRCGRHSVSGRFTILGFNHTLEIPAGIGRCNKLEVFVCNEIGLKQLPAELGGCAALAELYCGRNELGELPAELGCCEALQRVHCMHCDLKSFPAELGQCPAFAELYCDDNPLESPWSELAVEFGDDPYGVNQTPIITYLRERAADSRRRVKAAPAQ